MKIINIHTPQQDYPIYIGSDLFSDSLLLSQHITSSQVMIVSNGAIAKCYLEKITQALPDHYCQHILLPDGEAHKNLQNLSTIFDTLIENGFKRDATLIALGGGVIGDMTGFAASCYQRGMPFIQIPTSLLAQVDASIGGKTAVNYHDKKNFIGAFYQPQAVFIDIDTLKTLPQREYLSGLAEVIKHAAIADADFFTWLEQNHTAICDKQASVLTEMLYRSASIKADVVQQDEKEEKGIRELLNFGHTFAHAIESATDFKRYLHGEAVAIGMVMAAQLSEQLCQLDPSITKRLQVLLQKIGLPTILAEDIDSQQLQTLMAHDKKHRDGQQRFVLLEALGKAVVKQA